MNNRQKKAAKRLMKSKSGIVILVILIIISAVMYYMSSAKTEIDPDAAAEFHFIDVGQGDATMIITDESVVLIDCGPVASADVLVEYIKGYTDKIDCFVVSHAHEDHMGAMAAVINEFEIGEVIMTEYDSESAFYGRALDAMEDNDVYPTMAVVGDVHTVGDVKLEILSPSKDYDDHNSNSIILRAEVDGASAMFTGDAETVAEKDVVKNFGRKLTSNILKVGHHGSSTSTSEDFYRAVDPDIAVISCGKDNSYGHPHRETVEMFKEYSQEYYRTDELGTVVLVCKDGKIELK